MNMFNDQKIILLSVDHYQVTDESGKTNEGTTAYYYANASLDPISENDNSKGIKPAKLSLPAAFLKDHPSIKVPCYALVDYSMKPDSKGKMSLVASNLRVLDEVLKVTSSKA